MTVSEALRRGIRDSGLSAYALGKLADVDPHQISRFLDGRRGLTANTIDRLAEALGLRLVTAPRPKGRPRRAKVTGSSAS